MKHISYRDVERTIAMSRRPPGPPGPPSEPSEHPFRLNRERSILGSAVSAFADHLSLESAGTSLDLHASTRNNDPFKYSREQHSRDLARGYGGMHAKSRAPFRDSDLPSDAVVTQRREARDISPPVFHLPYDLLWEPPPPEESSAIAAGDCRRVDRASPSAAAALSYEARRILNAARTVQGLVRIDDGAEADGAAHELRPDLERAEGTPDEKHNEELPFKLINEIWEPKESDEVFAREDRTQAASRDRPATAPFTTSGRHIANEIEQNAHRPSLASPTTAPASGTSRKSNVFYTQPERPENWHPAFHSFCRKYDVEPPDSAVDGGKGKEHPSQPSASRDVQLNENIIKGNARAVAGDMKRDKWSPLPYWLTDQTKRDPVPEERRIASSSVNLSRNHKPKTIPNHPTAEKNCTKINFNSAKSSCDKVTKECTQSNKLLRGLRCAAEGNKRSEPKYDWWQERDSVSNTSAELTHDKGNTSENPELLKAVSTAMRYDLRGKKLLDATTLGKITYAPTHHTHRFGQEEARIQQASKHTEMIPGEVTLDTFTSDNVGVSVSGPSADVSDDNINTQEPAVRDSGTTDPNLEEAGRSDSLDTTEAGLVAPAADNIPAAAATNEANVKQDIATGGKVKGKPQPKPKQNVKGKHRKKRK